MTEGYHDTAFYEWNGLAGLCRKSARRCGRQDASRAFFVTVLRGNRLVLRIKCDLLETVSGADGYDANRTALDRNCGQDVKGQQRLQQDRQCREQRDLSMFSSPHHDG